MTPGQKNLALAAVAALVIGYFVLSEDNGGSAIDPTGNGPGTAGGGQSFNASHVAEQLYEAMRYSGTDEAAIVATLSRITPAQFAQVFTVFGRRSYNKTYGNQINYSPWTPLELYNLQVWLQNELSADDYAILRMKYPNYL